MSVGKFCYFYKDTGKIIYNDINLINNTRDYDLVDRMNSEVINDLEIFTDGFKYYHKSRAFDQEITEKYIFLEWKQTRKGDWDWFKTELSPLYMKCLKENIQSNKLCIDFENAKKLRNEQFRLEVLEQINMISSKYTNQTNQIVLASKISNILDKFEI